MITNFGELDTNFHALLLPSCLLPALTMKQNLYHLDIHNHVFKIIRSLFDCI